MMDRGPAEGRRRGGRGRRPGDGRDEPGAETGEGDRAGECRDTGDPAGSAVTRETEQIFVDPS